MLKLLRQIWESNSPSSNRVNSQLVLKIFKKSDALSSNYQKGKKTIHSPQTKSPPKQLTPLR